MNDLPVAQFSFEDFKFSSFQFQSLNDESKRPNLGISIDPSGSFNLEKKIFNLYLLIKVADTNILDREYVTLNFNAIFKFKEVNSVQEIPDFFYQNSIAIAFPYIRSFISNLSLQANWRPLVIPILNLSDLATILMENTKISD